MRARDMHSPTLSARNASTDIISPPAKAASVHPSLPPARPTNNLVGRPTPSIHLAMRPFLALAALLAAAAPLAAQQPSLGYYRYPAVSGNTIVFTAEGDLWRVPISGEIGRAHV